MVGTFFCASKALKLNLLSTFDQFDPITLGKSSRAIGFFFSHSRVWEANRLHWRRTLVDMVYGPKNAKR